MKKNVAHKCISFAVPKWGECLLVQLPFELRIQVPIQLLLEREANLLDQNLIELDFEQPRMW